MLKHDTRKREIDFELEDVLKLRRSGMSIEETRRYLGASQGEFKKFYDENKEAIKGDFFEDQLPEGYIEKILESYENEVSANQISREFKISIPRLNSILKKRGVEKRGQKQLYYYNGYFDQIDTPQKAYYLGLIMADGNVGQVRNYSYSNSKMKNTIGRFGISLQHRDGYLIDGLAKELNCECHLRDVQKEGNRQPQRCLRFSSMGLVADLIKHGVRQRKSREGVILPDSLPKELVRFFIHGYLDGDGGFTYCINNGYIKFNMNIASDENFINILKEFFEENVTKSHVQTRHDHNFERNGICILRISSRRGLMDVYNYFYANPKTIFLKRKEEKLLEILELSKNGSRVE